MRTSKTTVMGLVGRYFQRVTLLVNETGDAYFAVNVNGTYSEIDLPTAFRSCGDVSSMAARAGLFVRGGAVLASKLPEHGWKVATTLSEMVDSSHPTLSITDSQYLAVLMHYESANVDRIAA